MNLAGKVTLITGASEGIGAACADLAYRRGARVALLSRSAEKLSEMAPPNALVVPADLANPAQRIAAINRVIAHFGRIDILINNAGIGIYQPTALIDLADAHRLFEINFFAVLHLCQLAIPHMQRGSSIANISSVAGKMALPWATMYSSTKFALEALSDGLRVELKPQGIHVLTVCPGHIRTAFQQHVIRGAPPRAMATSQSRFTTTAGHCALAILDAIESERKTIVTPWIYWLPIFAARLIPSLFERQSARILLEEDKGSDR